MDAQRTADDLYALPPNAFTSARDEQVARARNAGEKQAAASLAALKRPTVSAWLVNVVALRRPEVIARLLEAAAAIRGATDAAHLRELSQRRRREIDNALAVAREQAASAGAGEPTRAQLAEVESTLTAAMADAEAAALVLSGRVIKALSYGGFGGLGDLGGAFVSTGPAASSRPGAGTGRAAAGASRPVPASAGAGAVADRAARAARAVAQAKVDQATTALAEAADLEASARRDVEEITAAIDAFRLRLEEAERGARAARQRRLTAERDLAAAQRRLARTS